MVNFVFLTVWHTTPVLEAKGSFQRNNLESPPWIYCKNLELSRDFQLDLPYCLWVFILLLFFPGLVEPKKCQNHLIKTQNQSAYLLPNSSYYQAKNSRNRHKASPKWTYMYIYMYPYKIQMNYSFWPIRAKLSAVDSSISSPLFWPTVVGDKGCKPKGHRSWLCESQFFDPCAGSKAGK